MYIGGTSTRTQKYKKFLVDILRTHNCKTVFDVACGTGWVIHVFGLIKFLDQGKNSYKTPHLHKFTYTCICRVDSVMLLEEGFEVQSADISDKMLKQAYQTRWNRRREEIFDRWGNK